MFDKKVIAFVGMPGAGKSICVDYLKERGFPSVYFGGVVVDEAARRYGETSEEHEKEVREEFRAQDGMGAIAKRLIPRIEELLNTNERVVADGLYSWAEYKMFKEKWGENAVIIAITAPRVVRHQRLAERAIRPLTEADAMSRDYAEIENLEKGGPIANADFTLVNDKTSDDMLTALGALIDSIA